MDAVLDDTRTLQLELAGFLRTPLLAG